MAVNYNKMTMAQLKAELSKRNLQISGKKSELVARLDENDKLVKAATKLTDDEEKQDTTTEKEASEEKMEMGDIKESNVITGDKPENDESEMKADVEDNKAVDESVELKQEVKRDTVEEELADEKKLNETEEATMETEQTDVKSDPKISEADAADIINQIDDLMSEETENNTEEVKLEELKTDEDKETTETSEEKVEEKDEIKPEGDKENPEASEEKLEDDEESKKEKEKPDEPKVVLKTDDYDFTKCATGFVIALDNGRDVVIPVKDMLKIDMKSRRRSKTVLIYPLSINDLSAGKLNPFIEKCCHFNISFHEHSHEKQKSTQGYAEFIFATDEEAHEQADLMAEMNDDLVVRQLSHKDKPNNTYNDIPQELITVNNMLKKYIYIGNLPSTATEEELQALFPESNNLAVIVNNDGLPKGYALAELPTTEAVDEAVKQSMKNNYPGYENKLLIMRPWSKIPKGILDSSTRRDLLDKIRNLRKLKMKCTDDIVRNRLENDMAIMKMKLDKDCKTRDEVGLPVPPDIVRLEEAKAAKRESDKGRDKAGSNISTIQRGNKSVRRGIGASITTAGTFGGNQGFKKPYQNQGGRGGFSGRQNYRGGNQGFRGGNQGFRSGNNQGYRSGSQGYQSNNQNYQGGFQGAKQGYGVGSSGNGGYESGRQGFGQGYGSNYGNPKQGYGSGQGVSEPRMNNAVEMLMQVSKMLGTNQTSSGTGYSSQGFNSNSQGSNYSSNNFGSQSNFGNQGGNFGGSYSNRGGGYSGGYKRRGDDAGYGGGGKRNTGYYNQKRW